MKTFEVRTERGTKSIKADAATIGEDGSLVFLPEVGTQPVAIFARGHWASFEMTEGEPKASDAAKSAA